MMEIPQARSGSHYQALSVRAMIRALRTLMQDPIVIRFILTGVLNTIFGYIVYAALLRFNLHYALAAWFALIIGVVFNFFTFGRLVFRTSLSGRFTRFLMAYVAMYFVYVGTIRICLACGIGTYIGGLIAIGPVGISSFVLNRVFVFPAPKNAGGPRNF